METHACVQLLTSQAYLVTTDFTVLALLALGTVIGAVLTGATMRYYYGARS